MPTQQHDAKHDAKRSPWTQPSSKIWMKADANDAPLAGVRVLDFSRVLAGPFCTMTLADMGADVVKVEPPEGDETRRFGPPFVPMGKDSNAEDGVASYFLAANRGKRSIALDLGRNGPRQDRAIAEALCARADVVVENFRPGVAERLGIGPKRLCAQDTALVYASISSYGSRGLPEFSQKPGYDVILQGVGGLSSLIGPVADGPYKVGVAIADLVAGMQAVQGILAALLRRMRTGLGQYLDISMQEGQLALLSTHAAAWLNAGEVARRHGNAHPNLCPYQTFATQDGDINIACCNNKHFAALAHALAHPEWADDPRFSSNPKRVMHRDALIPTIAEVLLQSSQSDALQRLESAGVPAGPVLDLADALAHPQVVARQSLWRVPEGAEHVGAEPCAAGCVLPGAAFGFGHAGFATRPPPKLDGHRAEIVDELGL